jgi:hypothetical protein
LYSINPPLIIGVGGLTVEVQVAKVIGFQHWENGIESGYGSVQYLFGVPSMTVSECNNEGFSEGAGMTFVFEAPPAKDKG